MPYDPSIPGQVSEFELRAIEAIAALVPPGGHVVEVGSLMGRSSVAWARSVARDARVTCIDPWEGNVALKGPAGEVRNTPETFARHTAGLPQIRPIRGYSPRDVAGWTEVVDVVFEDSVHRNPVLAENIAFWAPRLAPGGAFCGHDYRPRFPDVVAEAQALGARLGREVLVAGTLWCLLPPETANPRAPEVAARLRAIAAEVAAKQAADPFPLRVVWRDEQARLEPGQPLAMTLRLTNTGAVRWTDGDGAPLVARLRLRPEHRAAPLQHETVLGEMPPDIVRTCRAELPAAAFRAGDNAVLLEVELRTAGGAPVFGLRRRWPIHVG